MIHRAGICRVLDEALFLAVFDLAHKRKIVRITNGSGRRSDDDGGGGHDEYGRRRRQCRQKRDDFGGKKHDVFVRGGRKSVFLKISMSSCIVCGEKEGEQNTYEYVQLKRRERKKKREKEKDKEILPRPWPGCRCRRVPSSSLPSSWSFFYHDSSYVPFFFLYY